MFFYQPLMLVHINITICSNQIPSIGIISYSKTVQLLMNNIDITTAG